MISIKLWATNNTRTKFSKWAETPWRTWSTTETLSFSSKPTRRVLAPSGGSRALPVRSSLRLASKRPCSHHRRGDSSSEITCLPTTLCSKAWATSTCDQLSIHLSGLVKHSLRSSSNSTTRNRRNGGQVSRQATDSTATAEGTSTAVDLRLTWLRAAQHKAMPTSLPLLESRVAPEAR